MTEPEAIDRTEVRACCLTISSSRAGGGGGPDESGPALERFADSLGAEVVGSEVLDDDEELIAGRLRYWSDQGGCELILTSGGTGMAPSDVTPEATRSVIEREAPGIAEAMRAASKPHTGHWMLSRAVAGVRGRTLIINFPGSPKSIAETGEALAPALPHALRLLAGAETRH
ncbi:MogA/MoaB family molybdenum cofactor biosynthesis protein [Thermoleophilia bacterium SCSIO 60948]|nr:MogA/MoaB family molybdenum cofactor biosynthesis protein [Thermoleophilia bacterium SCSIO 60948]